jgi:acid stress chaperone HdeB
MTKTRLVAITFLSTISLADPTRAQVTIDVAKITCEQYVLYKVTNPKNIAMWISGYYNGKINNTVLDTGVLEANADKVMTYCLRNLKTPVMQAAATALDLKE